MHHPLTSAPSTPYLNSPHPLPPPPANPLCTTHLLPCSIWNGTPLGRDKLRYFGQSGNYATSGRFKVAISLILGRESWKDGDTVCLDKVTMSCVPTVPDGTGRVEYAFYLKVGILIDVGMASRCVETCLENAPSWHKPCTAHVLFGLQHCLVWSNTLLLCLVFAGGVLLPHPGHRLG